MSLYIGEEKHKSSEDLLWTVEDMEDTWENAELISFAIHLCEPTSPSDYTAWLAKCDQGMDSRLAESQSNSPSLLEALAKGGRFSHTQEAGVRCGEKRQAARVALQSATLT
jgi:hypothetical protein